ncbi:Holliday junction resolvase RuvX [Candidatus Gracilibacteria bacterium]|nr:MAG: Holliday junction resolvase RuvX [Candidatus Gracilibacteria bacterium]
MKNSSLIAVDFGTKKSGLAYSVESFCFGHKTVPTKELLPALQSLIKEKNPEKIIFGMPYNIDGTMSAHGKRVLEYINTLQGRVKIPIEVYDERLTSSEAEIGFDEAGIDGDVDREAARLILERYLEEEGRFLA